MSKDVYREVLTFCERTTKRNTRGFLFFFFEIKLEISGKSRLS